MVAPNVKAETVGLMDRRAALEAEMNAIVSSLSAPGGPGISGRLVDPEGFPRSDVDIPAILAQRRRLAELWNDHKELTNKIDENLEILHSAKLSRNVQAMPSNSGTSASVPNGLSQNDPMEEDTVVRIPFAIIDEITDGSPAAMDGLQLGDEILKFGNVEAGERLQERLVSEALSNEGCQVSLVIIRQGSLMNLAVTPRQWHGRGLLGFGRAWINLFSSQAGMMPFPNLVRCCIFSEELKMVSSFISAVVHIPLAETAPPPQT